MMERAIKVMTPPSRLAEKTVSGAAWSVGGRLGSQVLSLAGTLVAVRFLSPRDFGVIAVAYLVGEFVDVFRDFGMTSALVQRKNVTETLRSSVFWVTQILSCLVVAGNYVAAPWIAGFYGDPIVATVLRVSSLCFLLMSLGNIHVSILQREMQFRRIAGIGFVAALCGNTVLIGAAVAGAGIWSVLAGWIVTYAAGTVLNWIAVSWRPLPVIAWDEISTVRRYSLNLSGSKLVEFFGRNTDNAIVGRFLGLPALGYYQFAYNLLLFSAQSIPLMASRVLFPALSQVQDDHTRFRAGYTKSNSIIAILMFPLMLGMLAVAGPFIRGACGDKWIGAIPVVRILAVVGLLQSLTALIANIYSATGRTDRLFRWGLVTTAVYIVSFLIGVRWGIAGVASAYLIANILLFYPGLALAFQLIDLKMSQFLRPLWPVLGISLSMSGSVAALQWMIRGWQPLIQLIVLVIFGGALYVGLMLWFRPEPARDLIRIARRRKTVTA
jgi:O-antigen/teichoic acid export membrane protein